MKNTIDMPNFRKKEIATDKWAGRQANKTQPDRIAKWKKSEDNLGNFWDNFMRNSTYSFIPEEEERETARKIIWENDGWKLC